MRDPAIVLLVLILSTLLLDYGISTWRGHRAAAVTPVLKLALAMCQGVLVAAIVYAYDRLPLPAVGAGAAFALIWGVSREVTGRLASGFAVALQFVLQWLALTLIWLSAEGYWHWALQGARTLITSHNLLVLLAYILVWRPSSILIGAVLTPFLVKGKDEDSLKQAGTWIGYLERTLILTFVLLEQWEAIGFLLTAKSILRFNDIKDARQRSLSEYVLLGTLVSFTSSIAIGLAVLRLSSG